MKRSRIKPVWNSEHEDDSSDYEMYTKTSFSKDGLADKIKSSLSAKSVKKKMINLKQHSSSESENGNSSMLVFCDQRVIYWSKSAKFLLISVYLIIFFLTLR